MRLSDEIVHRSQRFRDVGLVHADIEPGNAESSSGQRGDQCFFIEDTAAGHVDQSALPSKYRAELQNTTLPIGINCRLASTRKRRVGDGVFTTTVSQALESLIIGQNLFVSRKGRNTA